MSGKLWIDSTEGRKTVHVAQWTGVTFSPDRWNHFLTVHHGAGHFRDVRFSLEETRMLLSQTIPPHRCRLGWKSACYGLGQTQTVPARCLRCQIYQIMQEQGVQDCRTVPPKLRPDGFVYAVTGCVIFASVIIGLIPYNAAATERDTAREQLQTRTAELKREQARRQRAEAELVKLRGGVTFRKQRK